MEHFFFKQILFLNQVSQYKKTKNKKPNTCVDSSCLTKLPNKKKDLMTIQHYNMRH